jgi:hypothetical protein
LNLRQGQANSPDYSDFATTVVHDPADHDFMGGEPNPQERNETPIIATRPPPASPPLAPLAPPSSSFTPFTKALPKLMTARKQCVTQVMGALSHFKSVSRSIVKKWCLEQPQNAKCSLNTIFDVICTNPHAEVPEMYYEAISTIDNSIFDMDFLACQEILRLFKPAVFEQNRTIPDKLGWSH